MLYPNQNLEAAKKRKKEKKNRNTKESPQQECTRMFYC